MTNALCDLDERAVDLAWVQAELSPAHKKMWSGSWVWGRSVGEKLCPNKSCSDQSNCQDSNVINHVTKERLG